MKRVVDLVVSVTALVVLSPVLAAAAIAVRLTSPGPVLFRQTRVGRHGEPFTMFKFRSMHVTADDELHRRYVTELLTTTTATPPAGAAGGAFKLQADPRITPVGAVLRRFSIDELPQLLNVLRGEMSIVGPRPALDYEVALYSPQHRRRLDVKPGLTGLWQVSGRNLLTMQEMLDLDVQYAERRTLVGDLRIMLATVPVLLRADGAR